MAEPTYNKETNTLTIPIKSNWSDNAQKVYHYLCAPANHVFLKEAMEAMPLMTKAEEYAVAIRLAQTLDIDRAANKAFIEKLTDICDEKKTTSDRMLAINMPKISALSDHDEEDDDIPDLVDSDSDGV